MKKYKTKWNEIFYRDGKERVWKVWFEQKTNKDGSAPREERAHLNTLVYDNDYGWTGGFGREGFCGINYFTSEAAQAESVLQSLNTFFHKMGDEETIKWYEGQRLSHLVKFGTELVAPRVEKVIEEIV